MTTSRADRRKQDLLDRIEALAQERLTPPESGRLIRFSRLLHGGVAPSDLEAANATCRCAAALGLLRFGDRRRAGEALIRVFVPTEADHGWDSRHAVIEMVNDDMPFLVDSVMAALQARGLAVHLIAHPILAVRRDPDGVLLSVDAAGEDDPGDARRESWVQLEIDRLADPGARAALEAALAAVLADVRAAVEDWQAMRGRLAEARAALAANGPQAGAPEASADETGEAAAFLDWLDEEGFVFLGCRRYARTDTNALTILPGTGLGILRREEVSVFEGARNGALLDETGRQRLIGPQPVSVTKAARRSTVHRNAHLDVVGIKRFSADGTVEGEDLFVGLFTSAAYARTPREIPWLRRKVGRVVERSGLTPGSHDAKALIHILDIYPRDDLFDIDEATLLEIATGILGLQERPRTALFARRDAYGRFVSCLVFVPSDRHSTELRRRIGEILEAGFGGRIIAFSTRIADTTQARIHFVLRTDPAVPAPETVEAIEARIVAASRGWPDLLADALVERFGDIRGQALARRYRDAFPAGYREATDPATAVLDVAEIERVIEEGGIGQALRRGPDAPEGGFRFELYHPGTPVPLSDVLPVLEHLGLRVISEVPTRVEPQGTGPVWIDDFAVELQPAIRRPAGELDIEAIRPLFQEAFLRVWTGAVEDDRLNGLVLAAGLSWRQVQVLRAYTRFLRQARFAYAQETVESALLAHPRIAASIVHLFEARFDPDRTGDRDAAQAAVRGAIETALEAVANLDEDRILRRFVTLVEATLRTNAWQTDASGAPKPWLSLKFNSGAIDELPQPRPWREIFVHSVRMEGVHLRGGPVARGGIRWSDRREDFRTEILGLMKAQTVKNAVIVPVGAKGGFVVKRPPAEGGREALAAEGRACYRMLICGMLDLTDTVERAADGSRTGVRSPPRVVRHDGDDPYLVVAADKGTASFSDFANSIAAEYGFWLGDAFASGGSAGYDHKGMGITARGAWVSVRRHFRELGRDVQAEPFTCVGVGDMSGDVFGNGMLMSRQTRLVAAFNHLHIFIDPDPDPDISYRERRRLFELGRGSWDAYDPALLSPGGAVFDRRAKSLGIGPEIRALLGFDKATATPAELIRAILTAPVDLLWFGGIGTFVKAREESHADVGDKANDALRVDAEALRARVIGEGANLAMTQRARVAFARAGGRLNTDFIDNSAGVDCSDHEVNIKILLDGVVRAGDMTREARDALLVEMTDEVAALVLEDNEGQTQALTLAAAEAPTVLDRQARLIRGLERAGIIDRTLDALPDDEAIARRAAAREGLTRPEQAVLLSHVKLALTARLVESDLPDDPGLRPVLDRYFPSAIRDRLPEAIGAHPLRREIVAMRLASEIVDRMGTVFVAERAERTGHSPADVLRAFAVARGAFGLPALWEAIETLDTPQTIGVETAMLLAARRLAERAVGWLLRSGAATGRDVAATVARLAPGLAAIEEGLDAALYPEARATVAERAQRWVEAGAPPALAERVARLNLWAAGLDILHIAEGTGVPAVPDTAALYFETGRRFGFAALRDAAQAIAPTGAWTAEAIEAAMEDLAALQAETARRILLDTRDLAAQEARDPVSRVESWAASRPATVARIDRLLTEARAAASPDLAMLTVALRALRGLATG